MKNKRGQTRGIAIAILVIVLIVLALIFLFYAFPSLTNFTGRTISDNSDKECRQVTIPYTTTEPTTTRECSDTALLYSSHTVFERSRIEDSRNKREYDVYFTIENEDTEGGDFEYRYFHKDYDCEDESWYDYYDDYNRDRWYNSRHRDCEDTIETTRTVYLEAGQKKSFSYSVPLSRYAEREEYMPEITPPTKQLCTNKTEQKEVIKYRTEERCD